MAVAAGLAWWPQALQSRWSPQALALVHLYALGAMSPAIFGAMLHFVPVAAGAPLRVWGRPEAVLLALFPLSAWSMAAGFAYPSPTLLVGGAVLAMCALLIQGARVGIALWRVRALAAAIRGLRASVIGLAVTVLAGALLVGSLVSRGASPAAAYVDLHAQWGLGGWVGMLIATVASVVVPMFNVTDGYPRTWERVLLLIPMSLLLSSLAVLSGWEPGGHASQAVLGVLSGVFGALTLMRLARARRRARDAFRLGWQAVACAALASAITGAGAAFADDPRWSVSFGMAVFAGVIGLAITAMLYRIVPFLCWLHWQRVNRARVRLPLMHEIIPASAQRRQLALQVLGVSVLVVACWIESLAQAGAALWLCAQCYLLALVWRASRNYANTYARLLALPPRQVDPAHAAPAARSEKFP